MAGNKIRVEQHKFEVTSSPDSLEAWDLGTCIAVLLYDKPKKIAGLAYISDRVAYKNIHEMLKRMSARGSDANSIQPYIIYNAYPLYEENKVTKNNVSSCKKIIHKLDLKKPVEVTKNTGKPIDMVFEIETGKFEIK